MNTLSDFEIWKLLLAFGYMRLCSFWVYEIVLIKLYFNIVFGTLIAMKKLRLDLHKFYLLKNFMIPHTLLREEKNRIVKVDSFHYQIIFLAYFMSNWGKKNDLFKKKCFLLTFFRTRGREREKQQINTASFRPPTGN